MNTLFSSLCTLSLAFGYLAAPLLAAADEPFNGKDLKGWSFKKKGKLESKWVTGTPQLDAGNPKALKASGGKTDWFGTNGDVFPVRVKMTPFPPVSPNGQRSFPRKHLAKGHGEWNHYYIRAINGEVRLWVNGEEVSGGTGCDPSTGYLCLESEGSPILFRKLRIRELP